MALPSNVGVCEITGTFIRGVVDGSDPDRDPDAVPLSGMQFWFTPDLKPPLMKNASAGVSIFVDPVPAATDENGVLVGPDGEPGVRLIASDDPDLNPTGWTWRVSMSGPGLPTIEQSFIAPTGGHLEFVDIIPVPANPGPQIAEWTIVSTKAQNAAGIAVEARDAAVEAAESVQRDQPGGVAPLDGSKKIPEPNLPARLTEAGLNATIGAVAASELERVGSPSQVAITPAVQAVAPAVAPPNPNPPTWPRVAIVSAVQAGHGFTSAGAGTFDLNDTTDAVLGNQSIKIVTNGAGGNAQVVKTGLSLDMTGKGFLVYVKITAAIYQALSYLNLDLKTDSNNYFRAVIAPNQMDLKSTFKYGEWFPLFLNRGNFTVGSGAPSWSNITQIQVAVADRLSTPLTVRLGGFATYEESAAKYPNGVISLTFDDSFAPLYLPKMSALGFAGTIYPINSLLDTPGYLSTAQAKRMQDVQGWEIGAHATSVATHVDYSTKTDAWVEAEQQALRVWQAQNNFRSPSFAYPIGPYSIANSDVVARHYQSARGTGGGASSVQIRPQRDVFAHRLPSYVIGAAVARTTVQDWITRTAAGKGWLTLCFHDLVTSGPTGNQWTVADFEALMDFIATSGIAVAPVGRVLS